MAAGIVGGNSVCVLQRQPFCKGDRVKISDNLVQVLSLQEGHGGWIPEMQSVGSVYLQALKS